MTCRQTTDRETLEWTLSGLPYLVMRERKFEELILLEISYGKAGAWTQTISVCPTSALVRITDSN